MAKVSVYDEETGSNPQGFLFMAVEQPGEVDGDGNQLYITKKILKDNVGAQGPVGPQGATGPAGPTGADGAAGPAGPTGAAGAAGAAGADGDDADVTRSSTTSLLIEVASKAFTYTVASTNIGWVIGTRLRAASDATPTNYMEGVVTSVNGTAVTINVDNIGGSGTLADWNISIAGDVGATGATGATGADGAGTAVLGVPDAWAIDYFEDYSVGAISVLDGGEGWGADGVASGASIISQAVANGQTEKRLVLTAPAGDAYIGRQMYFGSNWNRIQIALLWRFTGAANFTSDCAIGVCSGTSNMYNSTTCTNFLGTFHDPAGPATWTYNAGVLHPHYSQSVGNRMITRRVNTTTDRGSGSGSDGKRYTASSTSRSLQFFEINRLVAATTATSVTYSIALKNNNTLTIEYPFSKQHLVNLLADTVSTSLGAGTTLGVMAPGTVTHSWAFDESTGVLDSINVNWNVTTRDMHLCGIAVRRVF